MLDPDSTSVPSPALADWIKELAPPPHVKRLHSTDPRWTPRNPRAPMLDELAAEWPDLAQHVWQRWGGDAAAIHAHDEAAAAFNQEYLSSKTVRREDTWLASFRRRHGGR